jgi:integration host factor subunit alpha
MSDNITKNTLAKDIFYKTGIPTSLAENIVDSFFDTIIEGCVQDGVVKLAKFASFNTNQKKARLGRNINTNEKVMITSRKVISFTPSEHLKKVVNEG